MSLDSSFPEPLKREPVWNSPIVGYRRLLKAPTATAWKAGSRSSTSSRGLTFSGQLCVAGDLESDYALSIAVRVSAFGQASGTALAALQYASQKTLIAGKYA